MSSWAKAFPGLPQQVSAARRFVASLLDGSPRRDDAVIVISELFTNALQHTDSGQPGGLVVVQVSRWRQGVRIAVTDQGSVHRPVIRGTGPTSPDGVAHVNANRVFTDSADIIPADCGRGLYMVSCLADHLDWHDDARGRTVHAVLGRLPAGSPSTGSPPTGSSPAGSPRRADQSPVTAMAPSGVPSGGDAFATLPRPASPAVPA